MKTGSVGGTMQKVILYCGLMICTGFLLGTDCQESMPSYILPTGMYEIKLRADQVNLDRVEREIGQIESGKGGFGFTITITNTFDETMAGSVKDTLADLQIWWKENPNVMATFHLTPLHEVATHELWDPVNVFFDPGDSVRLAIVWYNWKDDQYNDVWEYVQKLETIEKIQYGPMTFIAEARIQLFDQLPIKYSNQVEFTVTFYEEKEIASNMIIKHGSMNRLGIANSF
jgi:hypothetical protein